MTSLAGGTQGVNKELPSRVVLVTNFLETCLGLNSEVASTWRLCEPASALPCLGGTGPGGSPIHNGAPWRRRAHPYLCNNRNGRSAR